MILCMNPAVVFRILLATSLERMPEYGSFHFYCCIFFTCLLNICICIVSSQWLLPRPYHFVVEGKQPLVVVRQHNYIPVVVWWKFVSPSRLVFWHTTKLLFVCIFAPWLGCNHHRCLCISLHFDGQLQEEAVCSLSAAFKNTPSLVRPLGLAQVFWHLRHK